MKPVIEVQNLSRWYGNVLGLSDVTLQIEPGITGLLGPNGAGKSTFLRLITGQIKPNIGSVCQRLKVAQAIAHEPEILILDEPLNGLDPLSRRKIIRLIKSYKEEGKTIVVSSHVLPEIEAMTKRIILIHQGKIFAQGDIHYIRNLIESHPHIISIKCSRPRELVSKFIQHDFVLKVNFIPDDDSLLVETNNRDKFFGLLPSLFVENNIEVFEVTSPDDNLQAVFDYLIGQ
jgi:ABC-2 type transport system ATP-binding protein